MFSILDVQCAALGALANAVVYSAFCFGCLLHAEAEEEGMLI